MKFGLPLPNVAREQFNLARIYGPRGSNPNFVQSDRLIVKNYNGEVGNDFEVFYLEQRPDFIVPATEHIDVGYVTGSPEPGLTNAQAWALYGVAIAGSVADSFQTIQGVLGYIGP